MTDNEQKSSPFSILAQFLKDLSFENVLFSTIKQEEPQGDPKINMDSNVVIRTLDEQERIFDVTLIVKAEAVDQAKKLFIFEASYACVVQVEKSIDVQFIDTILNIEIPYYLFFEVRNICAQMTWMGNFPPLFMQPADFAEIYQRKIANQSMQQH